MSDELSSYRRVQQAAKNVLARIAPFINAESTERTIAEKCAELLAQNGITRTWYYNCPALVLLGARSCLSLSGRDYAPADERAGNENLVTIDLSPLDGETWGDCARSFVLEGGRAKTFGGFSEGGAKTANTELAAIGSTEFREGLEAEQALHAHFCEFVKPGMGFCEVFREMNALIERLGFENLDFMKNVGHTIEKNRGGRLYFEAGNAQKLAAHALFTFEPHIKKRGGRWGFKFENIYYFDGENAAEL